LHKEPKLYLQAPVATNNLIKVDTKTQTSSSRGWKNPKSLKNQNFERGEKSQILFGCL